MAVGKAAPSANARVSARIVLIVHPFAFVKPVEEGFAQSEPGAPRRRAMESTYLVAIWTNSTRRFFALPSSVKLVATGA